jgi:hypothetical protein
MDRSKIAAALKGHRLDTMSQDSGNHCTCGSDSRFEQRDGDHPWTSIDEHRADVVMRALGADGAESNAEKDASDLARVIAGTTDLWDEPLDEVHDIPQIVNAILAAGWTRPPLVGGTSA